MPNFNTEAIRTVALVGHGASGKTTLAEALLQTAGTIHAAGASSAATPSATSIRWKSSTCTSLSSRSSISTTPTPAST